MNLVVKISFVITVNGHAYFQVLTTGALHQIDYASLRKSASAWHDEFAALPKPLVVVNIGWPRRRFCYSFKLLDGVLIFTAYSTWTPVSFGYWSQYLIAMVFWSFSTGNCRYGADLAKQLTDALLSVLGTCGSIRIALSYRTPEKVS